MRFFVRRRLAFGGTTALLALVVTAAVVTLSVSLQATHLATGFLLLLLLFSLALYNVRKRVPSVSSGRRSAHSGPRRWSSHWLQYHVYTGFFSVVVFALHTGLRAPTGVLETTLLVLFYGVAGTGIVGLILTRSLPKQLARLDQEVIYERIPSFTRQVREEVEARILEKASNAALIELYERWLRPYFSPAGPTWVWLLASHRRRHQAEVKLHDCERYLEGDELAVAAEVHRLIRLRADLDRHWLYQGLLKGWLFLHIPLTAALLCCAVAHGVLAYSYAGGIH